MGSSRLVLVCSSGEDQQRQEIMNGSNNNNTSDKQSVDCDCEPMEIEIETDNEEVEIGQDSSDSDEESPQWRRRKQPIHQQYWSLKDMWVNYHEIDNPIHILCPALQAISIVLLAVLIVGGMTYVAYQISGSSLSVNRPLIGGVMEHRNRFETMHGHGTEEVVLGEHQDFETDSP